MSSPAPLPSLPPSPVEEDISRAGAWTEERISGGSSGSTARRGKEKEAAQGTSHGEEGDEDDFEEDDPGVDEYPPTKDEEAEARRIEENLRRWEIAERERRKAARESAASGSGGGPSLVTDITRRASLLWPSSRANQVTLGGVGAHHALRTTEDAVPLDDIEGNPPLSPTPSPEPGTNPFTTPNASTTSLNDPSQSAIMTASSSVNPFDSDVPSSNGAALEVSISSSKPPPPPQPLNLPRPRSPPPRTETPHADRPPEPVPPPTIAPPRLEEDPKPTRWWTEWLCGCSEGSDRGGDHQAGRTNPFE
ncbi:hypothetical protein AcV5_007200 [Taiwanofungus camphoratus]|nr:hypothetical protein AcV5_007200 [Antrodia cinnamomea]